MPRPASTLRFLSFPSPPKNFPQFFAVESFFLNRYSRDCPFPLKKVRVRKSIVISRKLLLPQMVIKAFPQINHPHRKFSSDPLRNQSRTLRREATPIRDEAGRTPARFVSYFFFSSLPPRLGAIFPPVKTSASFQFLHLRTEYLRPATLCKSSGLSALFIIHHYPPPTSPPLVPTTLSQSRCRKSEITPARCYPFSAACGYTPSLFFRLFLHSAIHQYHQHLACFPRQERTLLSKSLCILVRRHFTFPLR